MNTQEAEQAYVRSHPKSKALYEKAKTLFPDGVTHDSRTFNPFPPYIERTKGSHKWDVDGHEYICYAMGHGASILGYSHPAVAEAVREQAGKGSHYSGSHQGEIELAELIKQLFPSIEKLRFVNSGTEANMMAVRLARTYTGRPKLVKLGGNFHGWADALYVGVDAPFDQPTAGLPPGMQDNVIVVPPNDVPALEAALSTGEVAAVILEGGGAHMGTVPTSAEYARAARDLCTKYGSILIFDEVVTGFRWTPGGWQEDIGVQPDLSTMAKILMGAHPGGGVGGKAELLDLIQHRDDPHWNRYQRMPHPGTFNANPISVAAGIACLKIIATGEPHRRANEVADKLRRGIHSIIQEHGVSGACYGVKSMFHIYLGDCDKDPTEYSSLPPVDQSKLLGHGGSAAATGGLRKNMLFNGVDCWVRLGICSMAHTDEDIEKTLEAFEKSLNTVTEDGNAPLRS
ncbi:MAG: aspartate aminotransferase family protein [Dehalococcoidia bacterium]